MTRFLLSFVFLCSSLSPVESTHPVKHKQGQWLLSQVLAHRNREEAEGTLRPTIRVGLSGPPGAGKSTLVETLGLKLLAAGYRVAVLVCYTIVECMSSQVIRRGGV